MKAVFAFVAGTLFAVGLALSGMADPAKVIGFLDVSGRAGAWDPSLAFVMAGAVAVHLAAVRVARGMRRPVAGDHFAWPRHDRIDARLVAGAAIFGAGWGLVGICPGPGLLDAAVGARFALVFVAAMAAGMLLYRALDRRPTPDENAEDPATTCA